MKAEWKIKYEIEKDGKGLLLQTQGDNNYVFVLGNWRCGEAVAYGMHVNREGDAGGVIKLDDVVRLRDFLNKHIQQVMPKKWWEIWR
jgi:hypothetical protein